MMSGDALVGICSLLACNVSGDRDVGGYPVVHRLDAFQARIGQLDAADLAGGEEARGFSHTELPELIRRWFPHGVTPPARRGPGRSLHAVAGR